jgi:oxygen-independent coproporphyrinogen-3 oxidase
VSSIYVHIPFCARKCLYCDFYSVEVSGQVDSFLEALDREVALVRDGFDMPCVATIFLGGGTPSLFLPHQVDHLLASLRAAFPTAPDAEITLEANPGTVTRDSLRAYRTAGVTRLSLGVQSFRDAELRRLGRIHSSAEARRAVEDARAAGFESLGLDLIYAIPGQTLGAWEENLATAIQLAPEHLSAYALTVERHTPLGRMVEAGTVRPAPTELEAAMLERTMDRLEGSGYAHYEVSNYARPGFRCRHNLNYWTHGPYLGLGPSAHSFRPEANGRRGRRWWNVADLSAYIETLQRGSLPVGGGESLDAAELLSERLLLSVRMGELDPERLRTECDFDLWRVREPQLRQMLSEGALIMDNGGLRLTRKGYLLCDEIAAILL